MSPINWMSVFSAFIGSLIPPMAFFMGKELNDRRLGLLLGLACLLSLPLYYYSQVIRMYGLFTLLSALSYYGFLRALRTNAWKYWILMAVSNLFGFYTFYFMVFVILSEALILVWHYRLVIPQYRRAVASHLPALGIMSLWVMTLFNRYEVVQSYLVDHLRWQDLYNLWINWGTGTKVPKQHVITVSFNVPFLLGVVLGMRSWFKFRPMLVAAAICIISLALISTLSIVSQSILSDRYLLFLLPLYLALALWGWLQWPKRGWRTFGIAWIFAALLFSHLYYGFHYMQVNDDYRYHGTFVTAKNDDGHSLSRMAAHLARQLQPGEVVIHYSTAALRSFTFFTFLHFHHRSLRSLPEYVFASYDFPKYCGLPYLQPGEWICTLRELNSLPKGIWVVTLNDPGLVIYGSWFYLSSAKIIRGEGDLPKELHNLGYRHMDTLHDGSVYALHFQRSDGR